MNSTHQIQNGLTPLFHQGNGSVIGYRIGCGISGPRAIAVGRRADVGDAFHRLAQLPSLPRLSGELCLVFEDDIDDAASGLTREMLFRQPVDGSIYIAFADIVSGSHVEMRRKREAQRKEAYWTVLRLATRLGMIEGRGVRQRTGAKTPLPWTSWADAPLVERHGGVESAFA